MDNLLAREGFVAKHRFGALMTDEANPCISRAERILRGLLRLLQDVDFLSSHSSLKPGSK